MIRVKLWVRGWNCSLFRSQINFSMHKVRTIIVDDEPDCREILHTLLQKYCPDVDVVGLATNTENAFELINLEKPDLVFLDVQMPRADGFSLLKKFPDIPFAVVFVTSHEEYAIAAIRFNALDYLLKPLSIDELEASVNKALCNKMEGLKVQPQIINLLHQLDGDTENARIAIHEGASVKLVPEKDILFIEADGRYCKIYVVSGQTHLTARNLKEFEEYFGESSYFVRINKTYIVNSLHIKEYSKGEPFILTMQNEMTFEVSRRKKPEILEKLKK
ncbi:hypothetical protein CNR22_15045 [Sphingobacteriaceae bacterium]|nr:hypothetical protein CNR22_15045 [Sphingobacteriaceae bacterium]